MLEGCAAEMAGDSHSESRKADSLEKLEADNEIQRNYELVKFHNALCVDAYVLLCVCS